MTAAMSKANMKTIKESERIKLNEELTRDEFEALCDFISRNDLDSDYVLCRGKDSQFHPLDFKGAREVPDDCKEVMINNYVGVIELAGQKIEIQPKFEFMKQKTLLSMFAKSNDVWWDFNIEEQHNPKDDSMFAILEHIFKEFASLLYQEARAGMYRTYQTTEDNLLTLRGRLNIPRHIRENMGRRPYVCCEYTELTCDNELNQVLKACIKICKKKTKIGHTRVLLGKVEPLFDEVSFVGKERAKKLAENMKFHRLNKRFEKVMAIARIILDNSFKTYGEDKKEESISFLFDMSEVYEKYIAKILLEIGNDEILLENGDKISLDVQVQQEYKEKKILRPDMVLKIKTSNTSEEKIVVVDTKWKKSRSVEVGDLKQIDEYISVTEAAMGVLLYPDKDKHILPFANSKTHLAWVGPWEEGEAGKEKALYGEDLYKATKKSLSELFKPQEEIQKAL